MDNELTTTGSPAAEATGGLNQIYWQNLRIRFCCFHQISDLCYFYNYYFFSFFVCGKRLGKRQLDRGASAYCTP